LSGLLYLDSTFDTVYKIFFDNFKKKKEYENSKTIKFAAK